MTKRGIIKWLKELEFESEYVNNDYWNFNYAVEVDNSYYGLETKTIYVTFHKYKKTNYIALGRSEKKTKLEDFTEQEFFNYVKTAEVLKGTIRKIKLRQLGL